MENIFIPVFVLNTLLVLVDASLGYYLAPLLYRVTGGTEEEAESGIRSIRLLLSGVVALYMFFNCMAYFRNNSKLLLIVSVLVLFDLGSQLYIRFRYRHNDGSRGHS